jgi:choline dehydrogenase-like flavoprotein
MSEPEIVVIGSGAGGAACAWRLAERGIDVLVLEAGPAYDPSGDYRLDRPAWEQQGFPEKVPTAGRQTVAPLQPLAEAWKHLRSWRRGTGNLIAGDRRDNEGYQHVVGLGGSTLRFTGEAQRLHPRAMAMKRDFGVAADWPIDYATLEPYYDLAERVIGVAGPGADRHRPRSAPHPLPAHPLSYGSQRLAQGCAKIGLSFTANHRAALSQPYDGRPACNYCGNCNRGCPRLDKGSADVTFIAKARALGRLTVRTETRVLRILAGSDDRIAGVEVAAGGRTERIAARIVVLACGAVESPRLLLVSSGEFAPHGLANESGEVGRNLMETVAWNASALLAEPLGSHRGLPADGICWDFNAPDAIPGVIGGCRFTNGTAEAGLVGPIAYATRVVGGWGKEHKAAMRGSFGRALAVGALGESLPNPGTFIDLDPEQRDADGIPLARIHGHLDEMTLRRLSFMAGTARDILKAAGAGETFEEYGTYDIFSPTHVSGTCRMGVDPARSVVDDTCRSHRWRNLYVADASVFPSMGGGEGPALTISALALRCADAIADRAKRGEF